MHLFVTEHEREVEKAEALRDALFGLHTEMLRGIAVEMTRSATTSLSDAQARVAVKRVADNLASAGQISTLQPTTVLDVLVSHHILLRVGGTPGGVSFQHQQFQEWYASFEVADLMLAATSGDHREQQARRAVFNDYGWEEAILFACERLSRGQNNGAAAVAASIIEVLSIDPMLAAEMISRSAPAVWERIRDEVVVFAAKWHTAGTGDRAVRFMVTTGQPEFAPQIWPLISDDKSQLYFTVLRAGNPFRPAVLGPDGAVKLALLPDAHRASVLSEIASWSGIDGIELATKIAERDTSPLVRATVAEALIFRRADRAVAEILRTAPDEGVGSTRWGKDMKRSVIRRSQNVCAVNVRNGSNPNQIHYVNYAWNSMLPAMAKTSAKVSVR